MTNSKRLTQRARFNQTARELGVDLDEAKLKEALRTIASEKRGAPALEKSVPKKDG